MAKPYNIFISWSGPRSQWVAEALKEWLPNVLQAARPWLSTQDIEKGTRGLFEMSKALGGMGFGISCLTPENLDARWILYEAGALSKAFDDDKTRLWTYLLAGLQHKNVEPPLSQFQHTLAEKEDTRKLIQSINMVISSEEDRPQQTVVDKAFTANWPDLESALKKMPTAQEPPKKERTSDELVAEILEMCRRYLPQIEELGYNSIGQTPPAVATTGGGFANIHPNPLFNPLGAAGPARPMKSYLYTAIHNDGSP